MRNSLEEAAQLLISCFRAGGKLLLCGNGGSAADCAHISGELCKGFLLPRRLPQLLQDAVGEPFAQHLQQGLPAIDLTANTAVMTAIINDIDGQDIFAQQVLAYGRPGDVLLGLSTSGNAENVRRAMLVANALKLHTVVTTGRGGGKLAELAELLLDVDEKQTHLVQEAQIRIYHALCAMVEKAMFG
jgi:D-sedoheptulose 7-phosphate isomerase